jgi:hypothetical protein
MAEQLWLCNRARNPGRSFVDGVEFVVINNDDADTEAQTIAAAVLALNTALPADADGTDKFPAGYFDTAVDLSDLTTGPLATDLDFYAFGKTQASAVT